MFENPHSFFIQDAILSNVHIVFREKQKNYIKNIYQNYSLLNFQSEKILKKFIYQINKKQKPTTIKKKSTISLDNFERFFQTQN